MKTKLFPDHTLDNYLQGGSWEHDYHEPYSYQQLVQFEAAIDEVYTKLTNGIEPNTTGDPEFVIAIGTPGSGKTTLLKEFTAQRPNSLVHVDVDNIRENLKFYQDALNKRLAQGASPAEADYYAYKIYRHANLYIVRHAINRFIENRYNIAHSCQPGFICRNKDLAQRIAAWGYVPDVFFVHAPHKELERATEKRTIITGRNTQTGKLIIEHAEMPAAVLTMLSLPVDATLLWRAKHDTTPIIVARTNRDSSIKVINARGAAAFLSELQIANPEMTWQKILNAQQSAYASQTGLRPPSLAND